MVAEYISLFFASVFLLLLFLLHFLKPEFAPSWRMVSEYAIGRFGWVMRLAFFSIGISVMALLSAIWPVLQPISRGCLVMVAAAMFGAGIFKTNPITDATSSRENTIHSLCAAIIIFVFPIAASLAVRSLQRDSVWLPDYILIRFATFMVWMGTLSFFGTQFISKVLLPLARMGGPTVFAGWANRFMVVTYALWLITIALTGLRL